MTAPTSMHNLTTLIKRLEAATSRLEDIASSTEIPKAPITLTTDAPAIISPTSSKKSLEVLPQSIEDFDNFLRTSVDKYVNLSIQIGGLVAQQATEVLKGFQEQRRFLLIATKAAKPDPSGSTMTTYQSLLRPINEALMAVTELKEGNRPDPMYTHLSSVADGIMVLAWVTVEHRPHTHVEECLGAAQFFGNRVLKEQKDKDSKQVEWVQAFYSIFRDLVTYVKRHHNSGVTWSSNGESVGDVLNSQSFARDSPSAPKSDIHGSAPPPPPPPPPPGPAPVVDLKIDSTPVATPGGFGAVFSALNQGEAVTKGLRKVDKSEMTHKNPSLRAGSMVSDTYSRAKSPVPGKKPKPESMRVKKPPRKELEGLKWTIENYEKEPQPIEIEASLSQSVLISRCNDTTIIIRGKANQVTVENSSRLSLVIETLVSSVDVVKAQNFALQVLGTVPTVMLDQIDGAQIFFSKDSSSTTLFTSKSAGINLNVMTGPDDDYKELPIPSQICSYYDQSKGDVVNEIVAHAG